MTEASLLHELILRGAERDPGAPSLSYGAQTLSYQALAAQVSSAAAGLMALGLQRGERVGIYLEKRFEMVVASFAAPAAGGVFVPVNPLLKPEQVAFIAADCDVRVLVTSPERLTSLLPSLDRCTALRHVVLTEAAAAQPVLPAGVVLHTWAELLDTPPAAGHRVIDTDMLAILYTSGSTGKPKGVVLSHRNMVAGAKSVASYLGNHREDTLLAALPLSFDAGFSQLTTAFHAGARVVLLNYLMPRDVLRALERERVTGLTAVPPLYIQLAALDWPAAITEHLRYFANTGGRMPRETLQALRQRAPRSRPFLMYGLTEAFRSTYLPPGEVDRRPDSIGRAIPNAEILVLRADGSECDAEEPGELVHRGALVGMGYWNDAEKTAERYKPLPVGIGGREAGLQLPEFAVFSGDTVRRDAEGFLYFIGRRDEMIKTSGYRISPTEVEEALYSTQLVGECVAFGVDHAVLGQAIQVIASAADGSAALDVEALLAALRQKVPVYMLPAGINAMAGPLPRNPNGKIDRKLLATGWVEQQQARGLTAVPSWLAPWRTHGALLGSVVQFNRLLRRLSPACSVQLHDLVEQPVPGAPLLPPAHAQHVRYVVLHRDAPELAAMPRPAEMIAARFDQGAVALAVYLRDKYVGYAWLAFGRYDEDQLRCRFELDRPAQTAFDFDVYVFPAFRLGRAFAAVWHAVNSHLVERGVSRSCSRIASANLASQRAHTQLGARRLARVLFVRAWRWQLVASPALPWPKLHAGFSATPVIRL